MAAAANDYKTRIYRDYYKTHILPRKGAVTLKQLKKALKVFDLHFKEFLPADKNARLLDAGCGSGNLVYWMQQRGYANAGGVDGSPDQIEAGVSLGINNLINTDLITHLSQNPDTFDVIFMRDVLEHIDKPFILDTLDVSLRALKPGGRLVVQSPNGSSPVVGRVLYGDFTHETAFTETSLSQLFRLAGYDDLVFRPFLPYIPQVTWSSPFSDTGRKALGRRLAWGLARRLYAFLIFAETGKHSTITTFNLIAAAARPA
jgi:2-polyprenyl-3-methyl-5-hydroxy-6-metoxy-1,4-benzoquinol methylase